MSWFAAFSAVLLGHYVSHSVRQLFQYLMMRRYRRRHPGLFIDPNQPPPTQQQQEDEQVEALARVMARAQKKVQDMDRESWGNPE